MCDECWLLVLDFFFFFKQKTAYEITTGDWSSDVCSSDLTMTAGASNDIERAVEIARKMVGEFGMSPLGPIYLGDSQSEFQSQSLLDRADDASNQIINAQLLRAREVVTSQQDSIARLVELLLERDTVEADDIRHCFNRFESPSV